MITLIRYYQGQSTCEHCGKQIKNLFVIDNNGVEMIIGSECVTKLLNIDTLPKNYKQAEKEYKNANSKANLMLSMTFESLNSTDKKVISLYNQIKNGAIKADSPTCFDYLLDKMFYYMGKNAITFFNNLDSEYSNKMITWYKEKYNCNNDVKTKNLNKIGLSL